LKRIITIKKDCVCVIVLYDVDEARKNEIGNERAFVFWLFEEREKLKEEEEEGGRERAEEKKAMERRKRRARRRRRRKRERKKEKGK